MKKWSKERIWDWYKRENWLRGCNFMGSDCANRIDQWQELGFKERLKTADRELKLAASTGFNAVRLILEYIIWKEDHDGFMERLDQYLDMAYQYGIRVMLVFGNDCMLPYKDPNSHLHSGVQHFDIGYHGGRKNSQHSSLNKEPGYSLLDEPELANDIYKWVAEIIDKYKTDPRVVIWDLYNEPGNAKREELTKPHLKKFFEIAREINPMQPITSGVWRINSNLDQTLCEVEQFVLDESDIISYHNYGNYIENVEIISKLKKLGRPIICTEWLGRVKHNTVQEMFPLFFVEKIGCFNWRFVAGKYQTYEPWEGTWESYYRGEPNDYDFTKWFHDLYRINGRPYDPKEIDIIKRLSREADLLKI